MDLRVGWSIEHHTVLIIVFLKGSHPTFETFQNVIPVVHGVLESKSAWFYLSILPLKIHDCKKLNINFCKIRKLIARWTNASVDSAMLWFCPIDTTWQIVWQLSSPFRVQIHYEGDQRQRIRWTRGSRFSSWRGSSSSRSSGCCTSSRSSHKDLKQICQHWEEGLHRRKENDLW